MKPEPYVIPAKEAKDEQERVRSGFLYTTTRRCACRDLMCRFKNPSLPCPHLTSETPGRWLYSRSNQGPHAIA